ncbi:MAG: site-2 protease family protein [Clostridia bacterium]|nr:site-2 protease family protein [Clostridia bacterium]
MSSRLEWYFTFLKNDPMGFVVYALYFCVVVLSSLILHECAHGYVAYKCGDPTAKMMGRLSLKPSHHLDPLGTVCMFFLGFGWAKPVPVNPYNFRNYRRDDFFVSIAGICTNLALFLVCSLLSVVVNHFMWDAEFISYFHGVAGSLEPMLNPGYQFAYNIMSGSVEPVFASSLAQPWLVYVQRFLLMMAQVNLSLAIFNLLPIPPLDGYHLINDTLLKGKLQLDRRAFSICQIVLIVLCLSGALSGILSFLNRNIYSGVVRFFLLITGGA